MTTRAGASALLVALALILPSWEAPPEASAATGTYWGTVTRVRDGDTIVVDVDPPGPSGDRDDPTDGVFGTPIRLYGVNAFRHDATASECWGPQATAYLLDLLSSGSGSSLVYTRVKLTGDLTKPKDQFGRIAMHAYLGDAALANTMLSAGLGLPMPSNELSDRLNNGYRSSAAKARAAGRGIWQSAACGAGPAATAKLRLRVMWDADGDDSNLRGEWVEVVNDGTTTVDLKNWELRDASANRFVFPSYSLAPGKRVRVLGGVGEPGTGTFRWGNTEALFLDRGDLAVLLDPQGDIRAFFEFPCLESCVDPIAASIALTAQYNPPGGPDSPVDEWIDIWNIGTTTVNLRDHYLSNDGDTFLFDRSTPLAPGASIRVRVGRGTNTAEVRYWGKRDLILQDPPTGDRVELLGMDGRVTACVGWGADTCKVAPLPTQLELVVVYDGAFNNSASEESENSIPNGEWIRVRNRTTTSADLTGYRLEVGGAVFRMPAMTLRPGEVVTVFMGSGTATTFAKYWGLTTSPLFKSGGTANLWDPNSRLAGTTTWPCAPTASCDPPNLVISGFSTGGGNSDLNEWIQVSNTESFPVSLDDWWIKTSQNFHFYFPDGATIPAGGMVTVRIPSGTNTADTFYWGRSAIALRATDGGLGDWIELNSPQSVRADCEAWIKSCP